MPDAGSHRAQAAYEKAAETRQRSIAADVVRIERAIIAESDESFTHIMGDARRGELSPVGLERRLRAFTMSCENLLEQAFGLGAHDWWVSAVGLWGEAAAADPRVVAKLALQESLAGDATRVLLTIIDPPGLGEVLRIINMPVNGLTWRQRLATMTSKPTSRSAIARAIAGAYSAGGNIEDVRKAIRPLVTSSSAAARRIARTESVRIANELHERSMEEAGDAVVGFTYNATLDAVTRPEHAARHGRTFKTDQPRVSVPDGPNCVLPGTVVSGRVEAVMRAWYDGEVIDITLANGSTLSTSINHGVLGPVGFIPAAQLQVGQQVLCHAPGVEAVAGVTDQHQRPARVEEVFAALVPPSGALRWGVAPAHLHGDGAFCQGQIDVVRPDRKLVLDALAKGHQGVREWSFVGADVELLPLACCGAANFDGFGIDLAPASGMGGRDLGLPGSAVDAPPLDQLRIGSAAELNALCLEATHHGFPADPEFVRELVHAGAGQVTSSEIVKIERRQYFGHVYDLQCEGGWYSANGVLSKNCRCWYTPILDTDVQLFGRTVAPRAADVEAFAGWFDHQTRGRRVAVVGEAAFTRAQKKFGVELPTWDQITSATPTLEADRVRGDLEARRAAAREARSASRGMEAA